MELVEFLKERLDEDEAAARAGISGQADPENGWGYIQDGVSRGALTPHVGIIHEYIQAAHIIRWHPTRVLAEVAAKRRIIEWHESWPVLTETEPEFTTTTTDVGGMTFAMSKRIAWLTTQEYRARFGDEPPSSPILRLLALPYADHPEYDESWRPR